MAQLLAVFGFLVAFSLIIFQIATKVFPLWVYLVAAGSLGILLSLLMWRVKCSQRLKYLLLSLVAVLITSIYFIGTRFSVLPLGDTYSHYGLLQYAIDTGRLMSEFPSSVGYSSSASFSMYGQWPGIQLLGVTFAKITGINAFYTALLLPLFLKLVAVLFISLSIYRLKIAANLSGDLYLAVIMVITSSWLMLPPIFFYQQFALCLWYVCLYLVWLIIKAPHQVSVYILLLICGAALIIIHHTTPLIFVIYLFFIALLYLKHNKKNAVLKYTTQITHGSLFPLSICLGIVLITWWLFFSLGIWEIIPSKVQLLWNAITTGEFQFYNFQEYGASPSVILMPSWGTLTIMIRNILLFVTILVGFFIIVFKTQKTLARRQIIASLLFVALIMVIDIAVLKVAAYREIGMCLPFLTLCFIAALGWTQNLKTYISFIPNMLFATLFIFSGLTGLWGNTYLPVFLYDPNVSAVESGEHSLEWKNVALTIGNKIDFELVDKIITDEKYDASLIVPLDSWGKIEIAGLKDVAITGCTVTFVFRDFNIRQTYIEQAMGWKYDPNFSISDFKANLVATSNFIYMGNGTQAWITK